MTTEQDYYDNNNKHDLAYKCMQKDERIKELEAEKEHHSLDNFTYAEIVQHLEDYY